MFKVSNSKINLWRRCHYAYHLKYIQRLIKKKKEGPLRRGSAIHECLEAYNEGKSWKKAYKKFEKEFMETTFAEERKELGDLPGLVKELMENYTHFYENDGLEYIKNELHFELPLTSEIIIEGYIDSITKDSNQKIWPMETKTFARAPERDMLMFNNQSAIYLWAIRELGHKPEGMIWNILKAKMPSKPKILNSGKLSMARLDSTPLTVKKGIIELGLDPAEYADFIYKHNYENFFYRYPIRLNRNAMTLIVEDTRATSIEILKNGETRKDRNLTRDCSWCSYKSICQAELTGLDVDYIISKEYMEKESRGKEDGHKKEKEKEKGRTKRTRGRRKV